MRSVLVGPPGAGKGTQAVLLAKELGVPHISTGEMLRESIASGSELGKRVKAITEAGNLVPDGTMIDIIAGRLSKSDAALGFILDGFPRTVAQAEALKVLLEKKDMPIDVVVAFVVPEDILLGRIQSRAKAGGGRADDNLEVAAKRLKVYWEQTAPVISFYRDSGLLVEIDGLGTIDEVRVRLDKAVRSRKGVKIKQ